MKENQGTIRVITWEESVDSTGYCDIHDITQVVSGHLNRAEIDSGQVIVSVPGATAGITTIEYEPGLLRDLPELFEKLIPSDIEYNHDQTWHDGNGFSHLRAALLKPSLVLPVVNGKPILGTWQQIILIDFDNRPRNRQYVIQYMGV